VIVKQGKAEIEMSEKTEIRRYKKIWSDVVQEKLSIVAEFIRFLRY
jgi:hypothetical protein